MKTTWMGAFVAAGLFAIPVVAQETDYSGTVTTEEDAAQIEVNTQEDLGTGGSGEEGINAQMDSDASADDAILQDDFTGQTSDDAAVTGQVTTDDQLGTGGSAEVGVQSDTAYVETEKVEVKAEEKHDMRGLQVTLGGGMEGYTGALRQQIDPGLAWGVSVAMKPSRVFGLELGYTGAANEIGNDAIFEDTSEAASGADILRNGGQALATFGMSSTAVQPYALAGFGLNRYTIRASTTEFQDDWAANIPVGAGIRAHLGNFTADLRGTYSVLVDSDFADRQGATETVGANEFLTAGRWNGLLQLGTTW